MYEIICPGFGPGIRSKISMLKKRRGLDGNGREPHDRRLPFHIFINFNLQMTLLFSRPFWSKQAAGGWTRDAVYTSGATFKPIGDRELMTARLESQKMDRTARKTQVRKARILITKPGPEAREPSPARPNHSRDRCLAAPKDLFRISSSGGGGECERKR